MINYYNRSGIWYEMVDTCKGYGQAYLFITLNYPQATDLLRMYARLTPTERYQLAYS